MKTLFKYLHGLKLKLADAIAYYGKDYQDHAILAIACYWASFVICGFFSTKAAFNFLLACVVVFALNELVDWASKEGTPSIKDFMIMFLIILPAMAIYYKFGNL